MIQDGKPCFIRNSCQNICCLFCDKGRNCRFFNLMIIVLPFFSVTIYPKRLTYYILYLICILCTESKQLLPLFLLFLRIYVLAFIFNYSVTAEPATIQDLNFLFHIRGTSFLTKTESTTKDFPTLNKPWVGWGLPQSQSQYQMDILNPLAALRIYICFF